MGTFWGWDPKENGALLIILWLTLILYLKYLPQYSHTRYVSMTLFLSIVVVFSWFGINMLGIGWHSYGFMGQTLVWIAGYFCIQIGVIVINTLLPESSR